MAGGAVRVRAYTDVKVVVSKGDDPCPANAGYRSVLS
jgi:hypothetical protein